MESEESEIYERYQMKHPNSLKSIDRQQNRENDDLVDTDIDLDTYTVVEDTTEIKKL